MIPAGKWHDIVNLGNKPLKLYVIYAPPQHPQGTFTILKMMQRLLSLIAYINQFYTYNI